MEKKPFKTTLHISGSEFNLQSITSLFAKNNIKIISLGGSNKDMGAEDRLNENNLPLDDLYLILEAPEPEIKKILSNSEYKDKIDKLLGQALN